MGEVLLEIERGVSGWQSLWLLTPPHPALSPRWGRGQGEGLSAGQ